MTAIHLLFAGLCTASLGSAQWTQPQREWALGTAGLLIQMNNDRFDLLAGAETSQAVAETDRKILERSWGISSREQLLSEIHELLGNDSSRLLIGWNYPRAVNLARLGYAVGYLQENEAWKLIMPAAGRLQQTFSSWQELGQVYMDARVQFYSSRIWDRREIEYAYRSILTEPTTPWRKYPWNLDLGNGRPVPPSAEKTATLTIAAHPQGLICVKISVPNHKDDEPYLAAIEHAVGCRPRVTGNNLYRGDWILDTECVRPNTLHGAQVITDFRIEPIADALRHEGVTQLFTYFQHIPHGSSELSPEAHDGWVQDGWQWYMDTRTLRQPLPDTTITYGIVPDGVRLFLMGAGFLVIASLGAAFLMRGWTSTLLPFNLLFWGAWLVLSISFHGLAIAGFWSGGEGREADVRGLVWYGTLALLVRLATELILTTSALRAASADVPFLWTLRVSFWRVMTEFPFAIVLVLLCDPTRPFSLYPVVIMLALGGAIAFASAHALMLAEGLKGGLAKAGELHDAVFELAKKMRVPLRRLYILPEGRSPRIAPMVGASGELLIPERLLRLASRREIDGVVGYEMMLIKNKYVNSIWLAVLPIALLLVWRAYIFQTSSSENITLFREAGIAVSAFVAFRKSFGAARSRAESAFRSCGGDAEGWIAGLARIAKLAGLPVPPELVEGIAKRCGVPLERVPELTENGFPDSGHYAVPEYDKKSLVLVS